MSEYGDYQPGWSRDTVWVCVECGSTLPTLHTPDSPACPNEPRKHGGSMVRVEGMERPLNDLTTRLAPAQPEPGEGTP